MKMHNIVTPPTLASNTMIKLWFGQPMSKTANHNLSLDKQPKFGVSTTICSSHSLPLHNSMVSAVLLNPLLSGNKEPASFPGYLATSTSIPRHSTKG